MLASEDAPTCSSSATSTEESGAIPQCTEASLIAQGMDLAASIEDTKVSLDLFLNNNFNEARSRLKPWVSSSMYHALGYGTISYLQAIMTFDPDDITEAIKWVKNSIEVSNRFRRHSNMMESMSKMVRKANYDNYTDAEIHGELCYAESILERALITFIQDDNLISFIKGGLKIRSGHQSYKNCIQMLQQRNWKDEYSKMHFESGVRLGLGTFNLMISMLPKKIMKLLEFIGFSGDRDHGLSELESGSKLDSVRAPLCASVLICYHTVATYTFGTADGDIEHSKTILSPCLEKYPTGVIFQYFDGRIEEITGNLTSAIDKFTECIASQQQWRQFHHICYWELMWCHAFNLDWLMACKYADKLCKESRWSKATYFYQQACFLSMCPDQTEQTRKSLNAMFRKVPDFKQRVAGKSIPFEKFAVQKCKKFLEHGIENTLAGLELIYTWNGFDIIGQKEELLLPVIDIVESTIKNLNKTKGGNVCYSDDYGLAMLLKGLCLRSLRRPSQAEMCFQEVIEQEGKILYNNYLVPYATMELGLLYLQHNRLSEAKLFLLQSRSKKKFMLENKLHFKVHSAVNNLRVKLEAASNNNHTASTQDLDSLDEESIAEGENGQDGAAVSMATEDAISQS
ncbi:tetratricopeptide repeat protein 39B-like isoform X1 [Acanthaster planci]|uniref:Tetratricopeptide repeat protein 39B-like isoform X1 n=2 Tax=Acanthaster planci TaxID=133434 RepID=A0A8B7Y478_ACAPL|nr:tetratricopeptide repeat protein 39B-like isoform X1 [Acanthaster planci]